VSSVANDPDDNCLCEAHKAFLVHYMAEELRRQEQVATRFLRERRRAKQLKAVSML
jgi:hypothetical protein